MQEEDLISIHDKMLNEIILNFGKIDKIYYCTDVFDESICRKPNVGMGIQAMSDFPDIEQNKSVMVGDSVSDMEFGNRLGFYCIMINSNDSYLASKINCDFIFNSLFDFYNSLNVED